MIERELIRQVKKLQDDVDYLLRLQGALALKTASSILRVWESGDNWVAEIVLSGVTLAANTTTDVDTGIDLTTYGTQDRGGYKVFGTIVGDDNNSNAKSGVFEGMFRWVTSMTQNAGSFLQTSDATMLAAVELRTDGTNIQIRFTNNHATQAVNACVIHCFLSKQDL